MRRIVSARRTPTGAYKRSKILGEAVVEKLIADWGLPAVMVLPSTPIGPCDVKPTPTGRIIVEAARGRIPAFVDTGLNLVHVDDVAAGHLAALHHGGIGERYILGGQDIAFGTMLAEIAALTARKAPSVRLHRGAIYPAAVVAEALCADHRAGPLPYPGQPAHVALPHVFLIGESGTSNWATAPAPIARGSRTHWTGFGPTVTCRPTSAAALGRPPHPACKDMRREAPPPGGSRPG